jgi:predicted DNA-binding protein (UPF0251 family)
MPESNRFGPLDIPPESDHVVVMTVDEYETIRLIDLVNLTQEACAEQMNIGRGTVQGIYTEARKKLADALINGKMLCIDGGEYKLCDSYPNGCGIGCCGRGRELELIDGSDEPYTQTK